MRILKRDGTSQAFMPNKILTRIKTQATGLKVDCDVLFQEVIPLMGDNITTTEIDEIIAFKAADKIIHHPDYSLLGGRILLSRQSKLINKELQPVDLTYDFFAATTFLQKYSMRNDKKIPIELPSCMYERVAEHLHGDNEKLKKELLKELNAKRGNFATPIYTNAGIEKRGGMISCFTKDTLVNTKDGCKKISDIVVGDEVITHKNRYRKVLNVFKNELQGRTVKAIKIYRTKEIKATDNHEFLTYNSEDLRLGLNPSFKPLKHIRVGDFVKGVKNDIDKLDSITIDLVEYKNIFVENYDLYKATKNTIISHVDFTYDNEYIYVTPYFIRSNGSEQKMRYQTKLKRFMIIDDNFCKFIGLYYGDGHLQVSKSGIQGIGITSRQNNKELEDFIEGFSKNYLGVELKIYNQTHKEKKWSKLMMHSKVLGIFFNYFFGRHFDGKFLNPLFFKLSKKCVDNLLVGLISSDGVVTKKGELRIQIANPELLESIQQLAREFGYTVGIAKSFSRKKQQYRLDFGTASNLLVNVIKQYNDDRINTNKNREQSNRIGVKIVNGEFYYRVEDIKDIEINDEYVYDLNVDEDNSYSVESVVVHNCNLTHLEDDSFEGIENTLSKISAASKEGSGIGLLIDPLRSKESIVESFQGNAGGVIRLADMVQSKMRFYKQGSRSGSCALYLSVWHKDIIDFLELTLPIGNEEMRTRDLFTAVIINDLFMKKLENGESWYLFCPNDIKKAGLKPLYTLWGEEFDAEYQKAVDLGLGKEVDAKKILDSIIKSQVESGRPYVMFKDNANKRNMQDNIGPILQSNLCMTADQRVVSDKGYLTVKELYESGEKLNLFDGEKLVKSSEMKLRGKNEDIYKITLENGIEHKVTNYHGIPVIDDRNNIRRVECKDLKVGDKIATQNKKGLFGPRNLVSEAYLLGLYQSDGTQSDYTIMFDLWENDFDLVQVIEENVHELYDKYGYTPRYSNRGGYFIDCGETQGGVKKKRLTSSFFKEFGFDKGYVPQWIWESDEETHWSYIKGLLQADGTVHLSQSKTQPIQLSYADINKDFLKQLQLIFNNLGLQSSIYKLHNGGKRLLPNGKGGVNEYNCKDSFRLCVGSKNSVLEIEKNTGFLSRKKIILENKKYRDNSKKSSKVLSIEYIGKEDVYCPTIYNDEHIFIAQGMKTFNCIEVFQASKPKYTPQCTLASVNLAEHGGLKSIEKTTKILVRALNEVITKNKWSDKWSEAAGLDQRALAIGVAGLADFFAKKKISFESEEAKKWNKDIFETMYKAAVEESMLIAEERGENYPSWEGSRYSKGETYIEGWSPKPDGEPIPIYNSLFLGLMPTASCLVKSTKIITDNGVISYEDILENNNINWVEIEKTDNQQWLKLSNPVNVLTKDGTYIETSAMFYNGIKPTLKIEMEDGNIFECTYNHKFLVNRGGEEIWVEAENLLEDDDIVNINEKK